MNNHIGSSLNAFLSEEGMLEEASNKATRCVLSYRLNELMKSQNLSKSALANRLNTSDSALDHLLDPNDDSVTLGTLKKVAVAIGQRLEIRLISE